MAVHIVSAIPRLLKRVAIGKLTSAVLHAIAWQKAVTAAVVSMRSGPGDLAGNGVSREFAAGVAEQPSEILANIGRCLDDLTKYSTGVSVFIGLAIAFSPVITSAQVRDAESYERKLVTARIGRAAYRGVA